MSTQTADDLLAVISENDYYIEKILETLVYANHLTAASYLQRCLLSQRSFKQLVCIGKRTREVQERFAARYGIATAECENAFDHLLGDDETFRIGHMTVKILRLPGHTPDHIRYQVVGTYSPWIFV
jgi:hypothetical protein